MNADILGGDVLADAHRLPFKDACFSHILASHVLEHLPDLGRAMRELARVLKLGGTLRVRVPYGLRSLYDPFHHHAFDLHTLNRFCAANPTDPEYEAFFCIEALGITDFHIPIIGDRLNFHLKRYILPLTANLGLRWRNDERLVLELPFGRRKEITALLVRKGVR